MIYYSSTLSYNIRKESAAQRNNLSVVNATNIESNRVLLVYHSGLRRRLEQYKGWLVRLHQ